MKSFGGSAAGPAEPPLDWLWAYNIALARNDDKVTVLFGTHGQVPIKQDGSFMPRTVTWNPASYPETVVCSAQSTIFGEVNFMVDRDATKVARLIEQSHPIDIQTNNAVVDFTEKLKAAETKDMSAMARDGPSYLDELNQRLDMEQQALPLLTKAYPKEMKEFFRYCAFRHSSDGIDHPGDVHHPREVSLIDKEFLIDKEGETTDACKRSHEWHINIFYKNNRGVLVTFDIFPMLVRLATPLAKRSEMGNVAHLRVTSTQTIINALQVAGFRKIFIIDLTCLVFRRPLDTRDDWTLEGDHFSRILQNTMTRYEFRLVREGVGRKSNPGHRTISAVELENFRREYQKLVEAVNRQDSDAVNGPMCAIQRAEIAAAEEAERLKQIEVRRKRRTRIRKTIKKRAAAAAAAAAPDAAAAAARGSLLSASSKMRPVKKPTARRVKKPTARHAKKNDSNSDSSMGSRHDSPNDSNGDSSMREMPAGGRRRKRQTLKIQKRRRTNLRRRRRVTKTK